MPGGRVAPEKPPPACGESLGRWSSDDPPEEHPNENAAVRLSASRVEAIRSKRRVREHIEWQAYWPNVMDISWDIIAIIIRFPLL
jgi:hypothetical protein